MNKKFLETYLNVIIEIDTITCLSFNRTAMLKVLP